MRLGLADPAAAAAPAGGARPPARIVHVAAELAPYARTGGLGEAVAGLAAAQAAAGEAVTIVTPLHRASRAAAGPLVPVGDALVLELGDGDEIVRLHEPVRPLAPGVTVLFVEHDGLFDRAGIYGERAGLDYADNPRRFAVLSLAALAVAAAADDADPVILHAHDWHASLAVVYAALRPELRPDATVLTVHNAAYQGVFDAGVMPELGLPEDLYDWRLLEWYGRLNLLKGGLAFADLVTTVSPTHARELVEPTGGFGLHEAFAALGPRLVGILNGMDHEAYDPALDPALAEAFHARRLSGRRACKRDVQTRFGLEVAARRPLLAMVSRLVAQKGLDLVLANSELFATGAQLVVLGSGEERYESALADLAARHPGSVAAVRYDDTAERRVLAGADMLLAPSLFEPCGLVQLRAQRYGAVPVARRVGGLADTVSDGATGFLFDQPTPHALAAAVGRGLAIYADPPRWRRLVASAMSQRFCWGTAADAHAVAYGRALPEIVARVRTPLGAAAVA
jgi:starch synthase